jgi:hypothetical protein
MTSIVSKDIGDQLLVILNAGNNYTANISIQPAIYGQNWFRVLCDHQVILSATFAKTIFVLQPNYTTGESITLQDKQLLTGEKNWYQCMDQNLSSGTVSLVTFNVTGNVPPIETEISCYFEFVRQIPPAYRLP